jgi:hypothetical protein
MGSHHPNRTGQSWLVICVEKQYAGDSPAISVRNYVRAGKWKTWGQSFAYVFMLWLLDA